MKLRNEWDTLTEKIHHLEAEIDASQTLVRDVCTERDELRSVLDEKQSQINAEDQNSIKEMQSLLAEFVARENAENADKPEKSGIELLRHFAEATEKSAEKLALRAEVRIARLPRSQRVVFNTADTWMNAQHINQQNELIKSLQERIHHIEGANSEGDESIVSKTREVRQC